MNLIIVQYSSSWGSIKLLYYVLCYWCLFICHTTFHIPDKITFILTGLLSCGLQMFLNVVSKLFGQKGYKNCHLRLLQWQQNNDVTKFTHKVLTSQQQRFLCSPSIRTGSEGHPASNTVGPGMKWPRCKVDRSPPSSAQVKNGCHDTSASPVCRHGLETDDFFF